MEKRYRILRVGGINIATSRFLDFLSHNKVGKLIITDFAIRSYLIDDLYKTADFFGYQKLLEKLEFHWIRLNTIRRAYRKFFSRFGYLIPHELSLKILAPELWITLKGNDYDFVWVGDNDFDGSNFLFFLSHKLLKGEKHFIRTYKETRFIKKWDEEYMLNNSDALVFPHEGYIDFFRNLYSLKLDSVFFADIDWRYSKLIDFVKSIPVKKISATDGRPHVCLLTGRALCDHSEKRSGFRYYYVPLIKELVKRGICVHMHAFKIVPSKKYGNIYEEIAKQTELLKIEKPLHLTVYSGDYTILKRYDAGILHVHVPESVTDLHEFQKINIPNRFYEYQIADVVPIVQRGTLPAVEKIIQTTHFGIIYDDYDDLALKLKELVRGDLKKSLEREKINDFKNFTDTFFEVIDGW